MLVALQVLWCYVGLCCVVLFVCCWFLFQNLDVFGLCEGSASDRFAYVGLIVDFYVHDLCDLYDLYRYDMYDL